MLFVHKMCIISGGFRLIIRHLYQRTVVKNGKKIKAWYYWFYDENGKQIRRSCGKGGKPCVLKRDAEAYIASLGNNEPKKTVLNDYFSDMYTEGSLFLRKKEARGTVYTYRTLVHKRVFLKCVLDKFGNKNVNSLSVYEIDNWLVNLERSNSWKNSILSIFEDMFKELYLAKKIDCVPMLERFKLTDKKEKGIFSIKEIKTLFPVSYDEIVDIWKWKTEIPLPEWQFYSLAVLVYTALSTGMRSGEVRALKQSQFISNNVVLINCMLGSKNEEVDHLKKGTDKNKRWRVAVLPDRTVDMIHSLLDLKNDDSPYIFTYKGKPFVQSALNKMLHSVLERQGIDWKKRNISLHSTRYTYNTIMKSKMNNIDLRLLMGHTSERMTEYYDKSTAVDHLPELIQNAPIINSVWK